MAKQSSTSLSLTDQTVLHYEELMKQGKGDEDISTLYRLKQRKK